MGTCPFIESEPTVPSKAVASLDLLADARVWGARSMNGLSSQGALNRLTGQRAVCHDLMQYVAAAMMVASMPGDPEHDPATQHKFDLIQRQLSQMNAVLQDCLKSSDENESANVVELVRECAAATGVRHHIDLIIETPRAQATGDHITLRRAINNLLDNAVRAVHDDEKVVVRVGTCEDRVSIEVQDTGVGFGRLKSGRGLGMVSVADALDSFHGSLEISSGPGPGTLVRLVLPRTIS
jgi:signal transduction histidine kinase